MGDGSVGVLLWSWLGADILAPQLPQNFEASLISDLQYGQIICVLLRELIESA